MAAWRGLPTPMAVRALGDKATATFEAMRMTDPLGPVRQRSAIRDAVMLASVSADDDEPGALLAIAMLLAHALLMRDGQDDWLWTWEATAPAIRRAPAPVRAALMNGFRQARHLGLAAEDVRPTDEECTTAAREGVTSALLPVARSMSAARRREIAAYDYGQDIEKHLAALNAVLAHPRCARDAGGDPSWYPSEVVELAGYTNAGDAPVIALLLLWTIEDRDYCHGFVGSRWRSHHRAYRAIPGLEGRAILKGFRHCYEALGEFEGIGADNHVPLGKTLPWFAE